MAGDWIKLEIATPDKPEVFQMAEILDIDPDEVTGKLFRIWIWADQQTFDGNARGVTKMLLDRITNKQGFASALEKVGWIEMTKEGLIFPNFDRHNGKPAKSRALTSKRVSQHRNETEKKQKCNAPTVTKTLPEKRREENKITSEDVALAELIYQRVLKVIPRTKKPDLQKWADVIRLMRERDNINPSDIKKVFNWANGDDFWATNIRSPVKLREQFGLLEAQMKRKVKDSGEVDYL